MSRCCVQQCLRQMRLSSARFITLQLPVKFEPSSVDAVRRCMHAAMLNHACNSQNASCPSGKATFRSNAGNGLTGREQECAPRAARWLCERRRVPRNQTFCLPGPWDELRTYTFYGRLFCMPPPSHLFSLAALLLPPGPPPPPPGPPQTSHPTPTRAQAAATHRC